MKSILDPRFRYVPSCSTDVRKTFERVRLEQHATQERQAAQFRLLRLSPQKRSGNS